MRFLLLLTLALSSCGGGPATGNAGCTNGSKDGDETDVDCGGTCAACANTKACSVGTDCTSGSCVKSVCTAQSSACSNTTKDGNETDVDCGGGTCAACANGKACLAGSDCVSASCANHVCAMPPSQCGNATKDGNETDVDCGGGTCAPCANGKACVVAADCNSGACANHTCATPVAQCLNGSKDGNETDVDCGGGTCAPCANAKACVVSADCTSGSCANHVCATPVAQCLDNMKNGNETDVDCGGGTCPPCNNAKACVSAADCTSGTCTAHVCASPPALCLDNSKDGNETDVDCGGGTCSPCSNGKACVSAADCTSGTCTANACASPPAQCLDNTKNGNETDVDCGGGTCLACGNGKSCAEASDCQSGTCQSGKCSSPPAQCLDNTKNGNETDVDCGGGTCPTCVMGKHCATSADCASGNCDLEILTCDAPMSSSGCTVMCLESDCSCMETCNGHTYVMGCDPQGSTSGVSCYCEPDGETMEGPTGTGGCSSDSLYQLFTAAVPNGCGFPGAD